MKKFVAAMILMAMMVVPAMAEVESRYFSDEIDTWDVNGNKYSVTVYFVEYTSETDNSVTLQISYDEYVEAMTAEYEAEQAAKVEPEWYETVYTTLAFWK